MPASSRNIALIAAAVLLLFAGNAVARTAYVKSRFAKLYDGTTFKARPIAMLKAGTELQVLGQDKKLLKVKLKDGRQGWLPATWTSDKKQGKSGLLASMGKAARGGDGKDVSYTAGARGLSAEAESFAAKKPGAREAADDVKRMEKIAVNNGALAAFLEAGGLGDKRFFSADSTVKAGADK